MKKQQLTFIVLVLLGLIQAVIAKTTVAILPINQSSIPIEQRLSDDNVYQSVLAQLPPLPSVHALSFDQLLEHYHIDIVDEAIFELLVTGELDRSLTRLHAWESEASWQQKFLAHPSPCRADWLVDITIQPVRRHWQVTYTLIQTESKRKVAAYSFREVQNDSTLVSNELAKRLVRSLWRVIH